MNTYAWLFKGAEVKLDINKGDVLLGGKYKNSPITVEDIGTDELGQPTVNGRKLLAYRIKKKMPEKAAMAKLATLISKGPGTAAEYLLQLRKLMEKQDAAKAVKAVLPENLMKKIRPLRARKPRKPAIRMLQKATGRYSPSASGGVMGD